MQQKIRKNMITAAFLATFTLGGIQAGGTPLPSLGSLCKLALATSTGPKLTIRNYRFVKGVAAAVGHAASAALTNDAALQAQNVSLQKQAMQSAVGWLNYQRWNPLLSVDLYNPVHLAACAFTFVLGCRLVENYVVMPLYKKFTCKKADDESKSAAE